MTFTGSVSAGKAIHAACSETMKRSTLELGGNDVSCCRSSPSAAPAGDVVVVIWWWQFGDVVLVDDVHQHDQDCHQLYGHPSCECHEDSLCGDDGMTMITTTRMT